MNRFNQFEGIKFGATKEKGVKIQSPMVVRKVLNVLICPEKRCADPDCTSRIGLLNVRGESRVEVMIVEKKEKIHLDAFDVSAVSSARQVRSCTCSLPRSRLFTLM
jgi:hypothetical protein